MLFDEVGATQLIDQYNVAPTSSILNSIVKALTPLVHSLITIPRTHSEYDDLLQEGLIKVVALVPKWSRDKGKAYSFFSTSIKNRLNTILSGKTFNNNTDLVPVETLDTYTSQIETPADGLNWEALPKRLDRIVWRVQDPTLYKACDWYRDCLAEGNAGRERMMKTMCLQFNIMPADAEYVIGLVTVTLRRRMEEYSD